MEKTIKYKKWNYETHKYDDYLVPSDKILKTYSDNMDEIVNCCQCLKEMKFGEGYTSKEVHTPVLGFGSNLPEYFDKLIKKLREE